MQKEELFDKVKCALVTLMTGLQDDVEDYAEQTAKEVAQLFEKRLSGDLTQDEYDRCILAIQNTPILLASSKGFDTQVNILEVLFFGLRMLGGLS